MSTDSQNAVAPLTSAFYMAGFVLVITPVIDFATSILPLRPFELQWRFATMGLLPGFLLTVLLGLVLVSLTAAVAGHRGAQRALAFINLLATLVLLAVAGLFVLDTLELRVQVPEGDRFAYDMSSYRALGKYLLMLLALLMLTIGGFRASRKPRFRRGSAEAIAPLVGTSQTAREA
jgi:hypothetical protein